MDKWRNIPANRIRGGCVSVRDNLGGECSEPQAPARGLRGRIVGLQTHSLALGARMDCPSWATLVPALLVVGLAFIVLAAFLLTGCVGRRKVAGILPKPVVIGPAMRAETGKPLCSDTSVFIEDENVVRLTAAVNQTVAFQFILAAATDQAVGVKLAMEDLVGPTVISRDVVCLYRQWPITIDRYPNWYLRSQGPRRSRDILDVLVPINAPRHGQPFLILPNEQLPIWVEINIPPDANPGTYKTAVLVGDADGHTDRVPVEIIVLDIFLSPHDALPILARVQLAPILAAHTSLDPFNLKLALADESARRVMLSVFTLLHEHGLSPYTDEVRPPATQNQDGTVELDWASYDAFCGPLIDGTAYSDGRPAHAWPMPTDLHQPDPAYYGGLRSTLYAAVLKDHQARVRDHFEESGWLNRAFVSFDLPVCANPKKQDVTQVQQLAAITHLVDDRCSFVSKLIPQAMTAFGWHDHVFLDLSSDVDIWATPARYQHPPTQRYLQMLGKRTWLPPDRPPYSGSIAVEAPIVHARSLAWQAFIQDHDAVLLRHTTDWPDDLLRHSISDREQPTDAWLVYPGTPFGLAEPVPSIRLKQLQLGIQDYQLLRLLDAHGRGATAHLLAESLIKAAGTDAYGDNYQDGLFGRRVDDPEVWQLAASILIEEAAGALIETTGPTPASVTTQAAWAKFLSATRRIELGVESAGLSVDKRPGKTGYLVTYDAAIRSELRTPLSGRLAFGALPPGARCVSDIVKVGPIPEMGMVRKQLVAAFVQLPPTDLDGHYVQAVVMDAGTSGRVEVGAVLSVVQVPRVPNPITVDGDLADWPPNEFNIAGDFRLMGADEGRSSGASTAGRGHGPRPRAESQTVAYFCRNDDTLYIAVHAAAPPRKAGSGDRTWMRNFVEYQDLMPLGEDLVEIMIDPTNTGTQSGDLFHIVLKSTGNPIFERGVGTVPPIGKHQTWPGVPPACCVTHADYGWCAEIAIPIATFGTDAGENPIWGVNLARLEPVRGEYSDWARAARYCYDPRTLGNLVWPE